MFKRLTLYVPCASFALFARNPKTPLNITFYSDSCTYPACILFGASVIHLLSICYETIKNAVNYGQEICINPYRMYDYIDLGRTSSACGYFLAIVFWVYHPKLHIAGQHYLFHLIAPSSLLLTLYGRGQSCNYTR